MVGSHRREPEGKAGARAYVVGDVHGCLAELEALLAKVEEDLDRRPAGEAFLIFVGDLIDRGPDSAGVLERLRTYQRDGVRTVFLTGNHEESFSRVLRGEQGVLRSWLSYGGKECAQSYGVNVSELGAASEEAALRLIRSSVPDSHRTFLAGFGDTFRFGDYLIVHAGIRPGLPLENQSTQDLRWIRDPFLSDHGDHGFVVVHGHTIVDEVEQWPNRIGIDTGAYRTGVLTALVIDGPERTLISARA
ncbi:MAG TPA: metallophosphoesterase family protein [Allosphingosinicella sp.]